MNILPVPIHLEDSPEDACHMMSTEESDCGDEPRGSLMLVRKISSQEADRHGASMRLDAPRCHSQHRQPSTTPVRDSQCLAQLLHEHDIRTSFKTKTLGSHAYQPSGDFKDIIKRSRANSRFFLLQEYPQVLLMGRGNSLLLH